MSGAAGRLAKPQLRGHLNDHLVKALWKSAIGALAVTLAYKYLVAEPRKRRYAEFYRTYDGEAESERMWKLGLFMGWKDIDADNEPW